MTAHRICTATDLEEGGLAVTFSTPMGQPALAVRWQGKVFGYVNECAHASVPIDFERQVFDRSRTYLMCARHGAIYAPDTGLCVGGPCRGSSLDALAVREADGAVWLDDSAATAG